MKRSLVLASVALLALACGSEPGAPESSNGSSSDGTPATWVLDADPGDAISVLEAKDGEPGDTVRVVGRVSVLVPGHAAFRLVDEGLAYCGQVNKEDGCKTPWDYCCETPLMRSENTVYVEARDESGETAATSATGLRLLDLVVVEGTLAKDEAGNLTVVATGWYRRARPALPADVKWPTE